MTEAERIEAIKQRLKVLLAEVAELYKELRKLVNGTR
jgi:hypothetical protein